MREFCIARSGVFFLCPQKRHCGCATTTAPHRDTYAWRTTVAEQREKNIHIHDGVSERAFVAMRTARDKTLHMPVLILPSVQVNIRAGKMPPPETDGNIYLKLPVNRL